MSTEKPAMRLAVVEGSGASPSAPAFQITNTLHLTDFPPPARSSLVRRSAGV
jgi:hypothetical protein